MITIGLTEYGNQKCPELNMRYSYSSGLQLDLSDRVIDDIVKHDDYHTVDDALELHGRGVVDRDVVKFTAAIEDNLEYLDAEENLYNIDANDLYSRLANDGDLQSKVFKMLFDAVEQEKLENEAADRNMSVIQLKAEQQRRIEFWNRGA